MLFSFLGIRLSYKNYSARKCFKVNVRISYLRNTGIIAIARNSNIGILTV